MMVRSRMMSVMILSRMRAHRTIRSICMIDSKISPSIQAYGMRKRYFHERVGEV